MKHRWWYVFEETHRATNCTFSSSSKNAQCLRSMLTMSLVGVKVEKLPMRRVARTEKALVDGMGSRDNRRYLFRPVVFHHLAPYVFLRLFPVSTHAPIFLLFFVVALLFLRLRIRFAVFYCGNALFLRSTNSIKLKFFFQPNV